VRFLITGAGGFLGWRAASLLAERGHDVLAIARPGGSERAHARDLDVVRVDAGDPAAQDLVAHRDAVLHFAGVPDPAHARANPARAVRENAGTTANLLEGCHRHGATMIYPSTVRAGVDPPPDPYALSKWLGEETCRRHPAPASVVRLTSVYGPGQVAWEGATGAIAIFAARALEGAPIVIPGNARRTRDFVYVDDVVAALEEVAAREPGGAYTFPSGVETPLIEAAELVRDAAGSSSEIQTPPTDLPTGENESYSADPEGPALSSPLRPLEEGIASYVEWLRHHPAAESRAGA
jgi:nucleoside-diphosphate-sugar epimerase